ncbi:MAG TPA: dihydrofolate reductase family protein [Chitinophagaceae bacterium]|nr:dihydrofolate reductase family protein [Chitinophagaceae bacterium]
MSRLVVSEFVTLDGVMEDPGGAEEFKYGGWSLEFFNEEYLKFKYDELSGSGALLLGRKTYQVFAEAWPSRADPDSFADCMNSMPKFVVSTTLKKLSWQNSYLINGDIAAEVRKLKQPPGKDILVAGSAELVRTLMHHNLIDEYRLMVHPIVLGAGKRLFNSENGRRLLKLKEARAFRSGIVLFIYHS